MFSPRPELYYLSNRQSSIIHYDSHIIVHPNELGIHRTQDMQLQPIKFTYDAKSAL